MSRRGGLLGIAAGIIIAGLTPAALGAVDALTATIVTELGLVVEWLVVTTVDRIREARQDAARRSGRRRPAQAPVLSSPEDSD